MSAPLTFSLWLPVLNEVNGLRATLPLIDRTLFDEILAIDGGSIDGTVAFCESAGIRVLRQPGKGMPDALDCAYHHSACDIIVVFTPDGNSLAEVLPPLCAAMREGYDMVIVSRYAQGASSEDDSAVTRFGNRMFSFLVNLLFRARYTDTLVAYRAYRRDAVTRMQLFNCSREHALRQRFFYMNGWELGSAIRAARLGLRTGEIPGSEPARIGGKSKLSVVKNGLGSLLQILNDWLLYWPPRR